jgi:transcriptional regulator with XRE-family HTH domain
MKERISQYLKFKHITKLEFAKTIGVSHSYLTSMRKGMKPDKLTRIQECYPDLNIEWLVTGRGNMLNTPQQAMSVINNGTNSGTMANSIVSTRSTFGINDSDAEDMDVEELPVIPSNVYFDPNVTLVDYLNEHNVRMSPRVKQFPTYHMLLPVCENTMTQECKPSDKLAVRILDKENPKIFNGRMYILDLVGNQSILCYLTKTEGGYIASYENSRYSDDFIAFEDVEQIYKVVGLIRFYE